MNQTAIAHYAEAAELTNHRDMETSYFHLGKAEPPFGIGTPRQPPPEARVWSPQDWFALPSGRLFPAYAGDFQPRDTDGDVLQTAERLSIQAMRGQTGRTAGGAWSETAYPSVDGGDWIRSGPDTATPVIEVREHPGDCAMRNLPGKDGYGPARGTEHIERPDNERRAQALGILLKELAEGSGIDIVRSQSRPDAGVTALPALLAHDDGGVEVRLGAGQFDRPSTVDLIEETMAVAIAIAWKRESKTAAEPHEQLERATVAGIIAGHELVQSAGIRCPMAADHCETVTKWATERRKAGTPAQAAAEMDAAVALAAATEWSLRLPSTPRQRKKWNRVRSERNPATEPAPIARDPASTRAKDRTAGPEGRRLATGDGAPARPRLTSPTKTAGRGAPAPSHATGTAQR